MRRDGSLSYRMRNVFIQPDSYHNLSMMNERPLWEDADWSEIKRRVINRPIALNSLPCARREKIGTSQLVALYLSDLSQYTKLHLSFFFPLSLLALFDILFSFLFSLFRIMCRGQNISRALATCFMARLTNSMSLNASCCAMLSRRRRQKLSDAIIHECPAIGRDVRLGCLGCYFGSRVLRKCYASESL